MNRICSQVSLVWAAGAAGPVWEPKGDPTSWERLGAAALPCPGSLRWLVLCVASFAQLTSAPSQGTCLQVFTATSVTSCPYPQFILCQARAQAGALPSHTVSSLCSVAGSLCKRMANKRHRTRHRSTGFLVKILFSLMQIPYGTTALLVFA